MTRRPAALGPRRPVRALVVDDSHFVRLALARLLASDGRVEVVGTAGDGAEAVRQAVALEPDVVTLDLEMPGMDGLATLDALMRRRPTPVVMVSAHTAAGARVTLRALARGAVDFVAKPGGPVSLDLGSLREDLIGRVVAAAGASLRGRPNGARPAASGGDPAEREAGARRTARAQAPRGRVVALGASTGGVMALQTVCGTLPRRCGAPVLVAQHMPPLFTAALAELLGEASGLGAAEAREGELLEAGRIYVAPGGRNLRVVADGRQARVELSEEPGDAPIRPSVDLLLASVAAVYGAGAVAAILTGMGSDGTRGLAAVKAAGGVTLAQDEATSVVYGMPGSATRAGVVDLVAPVARIGEEIARALGAPAGQGGTR